MSTDRAFGASEANDSVSLPDGLFADLGEDQSANDVAGEAPAAAVGAHDLARGFGGSQPMGEPVEVDLGRGFGGEPVEDVESDDAGEPAEAHGSAPARQAAPAKKVKKYRTYTVKRGDTLSEIAAHYGVSWREMAKLNKLKNPDLIFPGQVFKIPND